VIPVREQAEGGDHSPRSIRPGRSMRHFLKNNPKHKDLGGMTHTVETFLASTWHQVETPVLLKNILKSRNRIFVSITKGIFKTLQLMSYM
jgi:hypothetical protein